MTGEHETEPRTVVIDDFMPCTYYELSAGAGWWGE
jgi:hypothetical protein